MSTTYDEIVYPSYPYAQSHPSHLATVARLFGLRSPDLTRCRVLELGCAGGGNLLPMAVRYPDATFVGIDLSARQVELGHKAIKTLGLTNLDLRAASITDVTADWGTFDYILCHGVYSWVPDAVQEKIMDIFRNNLSADGVGYVSYNTYPGWHMRGMLREIMCFHAARFTQPEEQVKEARTLLDFLTEASSGENSPHALLLAQETQLLRQQSDSYLYHEHLEEFNSPCYFFEFTQKVRAAGLQYLGDAAVPTMFPRGYSPKVVDTLNRLCRDLIQMEQYLDFVRNRMFRASLVCRAGVPLVRNIDAGVLEDFYLSSSAVRATGEAAAAGPEGTAHFTLEGGGTVSTTDPLLAAALDTLADVWPGAMPFDELAQRLATAGRLTDAPADRQRLCGGVMNLLLNGAVITTLDAVGCTARPGDTPDVGALARYLAEKEGWVPTFRHTVLRLDEFGRRVVPLLDGKNTTAAVIDRLVDQFISGKLTLHREGTRVRDVVRGRELITTAVGGVMENLRRGGALAG